MLLVACAAVPGLDSVPSHPATALNANTWEFWGAARARDHFQQPLQDLTTSESSSHPGVLKRYPSGIRPIKRSQMPACDAWVFSRLWENHEAKLPAYFSS